MPVHKTIQNRLGFLFTHRSLFSTYSNVGEQLEFCLVVVVPKPKYRFKILYTIRLHFIILDFSKFFHSN